MGKKRRKSNKIPEGDIRVTQTKLSDFKTFDSLAQQ